jgi:hypothetical protein
MKPMLAILFLFLINGVNAQDKNLPYYEIPAYPESYTAGSVAARIIDGLGFRFYWATEGLRNEDLAFKPGAETRTSEETIEHIYEMSIMVANAATKTINNPDQAVKVPFAEMRKRTLINLKLASDIFRTISDQEMKNCTLRFKRGDTLTEYPFWNHLNGPIADCLWHVGQIVSFRRSSGNPFTENVSVFTGTVRK